jgi:Zn-dependent M28 family amino/carboxypeptidase
VYYRWGAPSEASKLGAIGVVIRSVSSAYDNKPHTGSLTYNKDYPSIPAVAISNLDADLLEQTMNKTKDVSMYMRTTCQMLPDVLSHNVVAEINGTENPDEIIVFGGHLDSWDIGEGAHDDGAGVVQAIEVLRVFKELGIKPKRTIRAVLFMNEENGLRGAKKYAELAEANHEKHILAIESDAGGATPYGFSMEMDKDKRDAIKSWASLFMPYNVWSFDREGGGADIGPLKRKFGTPIMELMPDSQRYFDMHHSDNDVFENVQRRELSLGAITMSQMVYLVSMHGL